MAAKTTTAYQPDKDAGWGLIFRLNGLWERVDYWAERGDYERWELVLDRIFSNLMYRNEATVIKNKAGELVDVAINDEEYLTFEKVKGKIATANRNIRLASQEKDMIKVSHARLKFYRALMFYDIWLRKFMQSRELYLKETEHNPGRSLFGGRFSRK